MNGDPLARIAALERQLAELAGIGLSLNGQAAPPEIAARIAEIGAEEWLRRQGRRWADAKAAAQSWQPPEAAGDLAAELAQPRQTAAYRIPGYAGWNHNVLLAGPRKTGKTQLAAANLAAALSLASAWTAQQGRWSPAPFLGLSECWMAGNAGYLNLEMDEDDWLDTFRALPPHSFDASRIFPLHRRGLPLPVITNPAAREWFTAWLRGHRIEVLFIDTWGALLAKNGVRNFNDDGEVRPVLDALDQFKREAGVASVIVLIHMPHQTGERHLERFKGAGAVGDWADTLWTFTADAEGTRYLGAVGRARIDAANYALDFEPGTGLLSWGATGTRAQTQAGRQAERMLAELAKAGTDGVLTEPLVDAAGGHRPAARDKLRELADDGDVVMVREGRGKRYFLPGMSGQQQS